MNTRTGGGQTQPDGVAFPGVIVDVFRDSILLSPENRYVVLHAESYPPSIAPNSNHSLKKSMQWKHFSLTATS
jgi:hypothetical protein